MKNIKFAKSNERNNMSVFVFYGVFFIQYHSYLLFLFFKSKMVKGVGVASMSKIVSLDSSSDLNSLESLVFVGIFLMLFF